MSFNFTVHNLKSNIAQCNQQLNDCTRVVNSIKKGKKGRQYNPTGMLLAVSDRRENEIKQLRMQIVALT